MDDNIGRRKRRRKRIGNEREREKKNKLNKMIKYMAQ